MPSSTRLSINGRVYVTAVIVVGFAVISGSIYQLIARPVGWQWFLLAALTLISGSATVKLPSVPASISVSETFVIAAVLLYGPAAGTLTVALDGLVISYWIAKRRREPYRALFNMSAPALSAWCSAHLFFELAGIQPLIQAPAQLNEILPSLFVFAAVYFGLNSWLIAIAISLETRLSAFQVWRENLVWLSLNYFCGASVAVLLVTYTRQIDLRFISAIVPLLLVLYITFKTSMGRVQDANRHVEQVNRLYVSTIETLAMAIDAKDQITHGHIRRVQRYAVGLAREVGVKDVSLIKAIEAAALLHDMGKLAVPEYILNKPGRLTPAEFERMKVHASVGADILSAIDFPYPVVPIVRHHHECWDGSGYPDGIKGTEIPIGARILAVVDCFDALTSDRPYRPKLSDSAALDILRERKGSMYDPLVVHAFERVYRILEADAHEAVGDKFCSLAQISAVTRTVNTSRLSEATHESTQVVSPDRITTACKHIHSLLPSDLTVFFAYDSRTTDLVVAHTEGNTAERLIGFRIALGQRISGWVAANREPILNSDATLDLAEFMSGSPYPLKSCVSVPIIVDDHLLGVITCYGRESQGFTKTHQHLIADETARKLPLTPFVTH
jgi:putative nucleotidyltransferase with HDIG domain